MTIAKWRFIVHMCAWGKSDRGKSVCADLPQSIELSICPVSVR